MFDWQDFTAGWIAGISGILIGHPMDTIKTRQQTLNKTAISTIITTFKYEGVHGFYKGMLSPLLTIGPINSLFFGVYGNALRLLQNPTEDDRVDRSDPHWKRNVFLAGCIGGFAQCFIICPVELVKIELQLRTGNVSGKSNWSSHYEIPHKDPWNVTRYIVREQGLLGLFRGFVPTMWRDIIPSGCYFFGYQTILEVLERRFPTYSSLNRMIAGGITDMISSMVYMPIYEGCLTNTNSPSYLQICAAGGISGVLTWAVMCPLDVIKTRIQADNIKEAKYQGMKDCILKTYKQEGVRGFTRGLTVCLIRAFPVNAATFIGYEVTLTLIKDIKKFSSTSIFSWCFVIPFDVIKSRVQSDNPKNPKYKGMIDCMMKSYKAEGASVFMKGFAVCMVRAFPVNAAIFLTYEIVIDLIRKIIGVNHK